MKTYKSIPCVQTILSERKCDLCDYKSHTLDEYNWSGENYTLKETEVRLKEGVNYPEGGNGIEITVDICPNCFRNKLIPWFKSQGVLINEKEWDY